MDTHSSFRKFVDRPFDGVAPCSSLLDLAASHRPVDWLWPGWIPRGMLTLLAAAPGTGKSLVALDLARRIIAGLPFPDGAPCPCPGACILFVDAEGPSFLLQQRAQAWNIDGSRLFLLQPEGWSPFDLASTRQLKRLGGIIRDLQPELVIVDSLGAATPGGESGRKALHILLTALPHLAEAGHIGLLLIHHLRKRTYSGRSAAAPLCMPTGQAIAVDDLRGSSHIVAVARSILALSPLPPAPASAGDKTGPVYKTGPVWTPGAAPCPNNTVGAVPVGAVPVSAVPVGAVPVGAVPVGAVREPPLPAPPPVARRLEVIKSNLAPLPPPLGLLLEANYAGAPVLRYTGPLLSPPPPATQLDLCARWLLDQLTAAGEPVRPADLVQAALEAGFSRPTLYRARRALGDQVLDLGTGAHDPARRWALAPGAHAKP